MKSKLEAHRNALLLALALTAMLVGVGGVQVASAYSSSKHYVVPIMAGVIQWGHMGLATTSYNSGSQLGLVSVSQTSDAWYPLTISRDGCRASYVNSQTKLASGDFTVKSWILYILPIYETSYILYTQVTYQATNHFYYSCWFV
jgi:hypothetical protein